MTRKILLSFGLLLLLVSACKDDEFIDARVACAIGDVEQQPFNTFQVIGTHNSYRKKTFAPIFNLLDIVISLLPEGLIPDDVNPTIEWDYSHLPFPEQFEKYHVRSLEIDLYNDPEGGLYADQYGKAIVGQPIASGEPTLDEPGLKVMHIAHLDYRTHYLTFKESLVEILNWSNENPRHFPITVMLELKDFGNSAIISDIIEPFDETARALIAEELLSIFPENKLLTPKDIRTEETLEESIKENGWPTLAEIRGKVLFIVMDENEIDEIVFGSSSDVEVSENHLFKIMNNPINDFDKIQDAIDRGFIIRTRADGGTAEARTGDVTKREMAFESGAQIISTDYPRPDPRHINQPQNWTDYQVQFSQGVVARSNATQGCYVSEQLK